jgi:hypothetical protein
MDVNGGRSGAGARTDRHPVRSGQRTDGRNRNENPVAGPGPRAGRAAHVTCRNRAAHQTTGDNAINAELLICLPLGTEKHPPV